MDRVYVKFANCTHCVTFINTLIKRSVVSNKQQQMLGCSQIWSGSAYQISYLNKAVATALVLIKVTNSSLLYNMQQRHHMNREAYTHQ